MYKVFKFKYVGDYGGGMGIVAASTKEKAEDFVKDYAKDFWEEYQITKEIECLHSDKEGILAYQFYFE